MKNALSNFRHIFLLILLLETNPSLKTEVEANPARTSKVAKIKFGRGVLNTRGLLPESQQDGSGHYRKLDSQMPGTRSNDDTPPPSVHTGPRPACYPACVAGVDFYRESVVACIDYFGIPVHMSKCDKTKGSRTRPYLMCGMSDCDRNWTVGLKAWERCPESCTKVLENGTVVPDVVSRSWTCQPTPKPTLNADEDCKSLIEEFGLTVQRECPLKPCIEYNLTPSDWGTCDCKTWTQNRSFSCIDTAAKAEHPLTTCENYGLEPGATTRSCLPEKKCQSTAPTDNEDTPSEEAFDFCHYFNCSSHGTCKDNECTCEEDFSGVDCQIDDRVTDDACSPPSILQENGTCCESGIYNHTGHCCTGDPASLQLDKNGACCDDDLDLCGNCYPEEPEYRDIRGTCCKVLDAAGFCCPSGKVDECGVCDGLSLTCNAIVSMSFPNVTVMNNTENCKNAILPNLAKAMWVNVSAIEPNTTDEGNFIFTATGVIVSSGLLVKKAADVARRDEVEAICGNFSIITVGRSPICGNKVCEIGEATADSEYHCADDCAYKIARCEVTKDEYERPLVCNGHGTCSFKGEAGCECFDGYTGSNCEKCQYGFFHTNDTAGSTCLPRQAYVNGPGYYTPPIPVSPPEEAPAPSPEEYLEESPIPSPEESPVPSPDESPVASPEESPVPSSDESPVASPEESPVPSPDESPVASPEESPVPSSDESPVASPEESPVPSPDESPVASPEPSQEPSSAASPEPSLEPSTAAASEPLPDPSLEPMTPEPVSEQSSTKGTQKKDKDNDDDGLSKSAHIGIGIALGFLLFLVLLTLLYFFWLKQPPGTGYTAVPDEPLPISAME